MERAAEGAAQTRRSKSLATPLTTAAKPLPPRTTAASSTREEDAKPSNSKEKERVRGKGRVGERARRKSSAGEGGAALSRSRSRPAPAPAPAPAPSPPATSSASSVSATTSSTSPPVAHGEAMTRSTPAPATAPNPSVLSKVAKAAAPRAPAKSTPTPLTRLPSPFLAAAIPTTREGPPTPSITVLHDYTDSDAGADMVPPRPTSLTPPHTPSRRSPSPDSPWRMAEEVPAPRFSAFEEKLTRPLHECALADSLTRLMQKLTIYDEAAVVWRASDHAHKSLLTQAASALRAIQTLLGVEVDLHVLSECKGDAGVAVAALVEALPDETVFATVLKATFSQSIVAPLWLWLKLSLLREFPFKDVPLGWRIDLAHSQHSVVVTHHKKERSRACVSADDGSPVFRFQWNLQVSIGKSSGRMESYRFWISDVAVEEAANFDARQGTALRALVNPWCAERDLSLKLNTPLHALHASDAAEAAALKQSEAEAVAEVEAETSSVYRGWVNYKTSKRYEVCWLSFRESTSLVSIFTNDPQQDPVSSRVLAVLDLRSASTRDRSDEKRLLLEIATSGKKVHKFKFDAEASKAVFAETVAACVAYAEQVGARLARFRQRLADVDEFVKTERLYHSTTLAALTASPTSPPKPHVVHSKSKSRRTSTESQSSAVTAKSDASEPQVRTAKSLKETHTTARAETPPPAPFARSEDAGSTLARSISDGKQPALLGRPHTRQRTPAAAQSSAADLAKFLRFRAQMKAAAAQQLLDFPLADMAERKTSLRELCRRRSVVAYVLRDCGDLSAQFAVETLLKRDKGFLLHRGMNIVLIGAGAPKLLREASAIPALISDECVYTDHSGHLIARLFSSRKAALVTGEMCAGVFLLSAAQGVVYAAPITLDLTLPPPKDFVQEINRFIYENPRMNWSQLSSPLISWDSLVQESGDAEHLLEAPPALFKCEFGTRVPYQPPLKIEEEVHFYEEIISKIEHSHYVTIVPGFGPLVFTLEDDVAEPRALIWSRRGISNHVVPAAVASGKKAAVLAHLVEKLVAGAHDCLHHAALLEARLAFKRVKRREFNARLIELHNKIASNRFKFGVLLAPDGQCTEDGIYAVNQDEAELDADLREFLEMLGERVVLKDWPKFRGGLDVKSNLTGEISYYTQIDECEIMFHVAPLIPQQNEDDPSKKRYVGNDIVVLVFKKGAKDVFYPADMSSQFNHIYVVVEKVRDTGVGEVKYRVNIANKASVPPYPPYLEAPPVFTAGADFRRYLLTKLINGERSAISKAKMFSAGNAKTLDHLLVEAIQEATS